MVCGWRKDNSKKGWHGPQQEGSVGGVPICLALEPTSKKSSEPLQRTQLPLLSSEDLAIFFIPIMLFHRACKRGRVTPYSFLIFHTTAPQQYWLWRSRFQPKNLLPLLVVSPMDPFVIVSFPPYLSNWLIVTLQYFCFDLQWFQLPQKKLLQCLGLTQFCGPIWSHSNPCCSHSPTMAMPQTSSLG